MPSDLGMFALLILFFLGGRFIAAFFYPIYSIFNHILFSV